MIYDLAINVGNTHTSLALVKDKKIDKVHTIKSQPKEILECFNQINSSYNIREIICCCVVNSLKEWLKNNLNKKIKFIKVIDIPGIKITYDKRLLGEDRFCNIIAACKYYKLPVLIIDFGTATTFDFIHKDKEYKGGVIIPGVDSFLKSFLVSDRLFKPEYKKINDNILGNDTKSCVYQGAYFGYLGMVKNIIKEIKSQQAKEFDIILTGGDCHLFKEVLTPTYIDKYLTLKGLLSLVNESVWEG
jgi:type III pantothenate kinase